MSTRNVLWILQRGMLVPMLVFGLLATSWASDALRPASSFSALRVEFDKAEPKRVHRSKVFLAPAGMREEPMTDSNPASSGMIVIVSFAEKQTWLLNPKRKIYAEAPREGDAGVSIAEDEPWGVLASAPCDQYPQASKQSKTSVGGRRVEVWRCSGHVRAPDVEQHFDPALTVVVREETHDGRVVELQDIRPGRWEEALFAPPAGYRKASLRDFMTGVSELQRYDDGGTRPRR